MPIKHDDHVGTQKGSSSDPSYFVDRRCPLQCDGTTCNQWADDTTGNASCWGYNDENSRPRSCPPGAESLGWCWLVWPVDSTTP